MPAHCPPLLGSGQKGVVTLWSEPIQKTSRRSGVLATAATAPGLAQPSNAMLKGVNHRPAPSGHVVVATLRLELIQKTSGGSGVRATAAMAPGLAEPAGAMLKGVAARRPAKGPGHVVEETLLSGPTQKTSMRSGVLATTSTHPGLAQFAIVTGSSSRS